MSAWEIHKLRHSDCSVSVDWQETRSALQQMRSVLLVHSEAMQCVLYTCKAAPVTVQHGHEHYHLLAAPRATMVPNLVPERREVAPGSIDQDREKVCVSTFCRNSLQL